MSDPSAVLVVDDDPDVLQAARLALGSPTLHVETASSPEHLQEVVASQALEMILLDMNFAPGRNSGAEGLETLRRIQGLDPTLAVVLMTAYAGVALAVESLKKGAVDFVMKPWRNDALVAAVSAAREITCKRRLTESVVLDVLERQTIERALRQHQGNMSATAAALGLSRAALYRRKAKYGL
jgi:DNA-binding NtrC family response regulator